MRVLTILLTLLAGVAAGFAGPVLLVTDKGTGAVVLRADGTIETYVPGTPGRVRAIPPGPDLIPVSIAVPSSGLLVYALIPNADDKTSQLLSYDMPTGETRQTWTVRGTGRFLEVTSSGMACVIGLKPRARNETPENWTVTMLDLATEQASEPFNLGLVPTGVALRDREGNSPRLFVSGLDRVMTFQMDPPAPSWFYQSPGDNRALALPREGDALFLLRDEAFVIIDPSRRQMQNGRVQLTSDDATSVLPLPEAGSLVAASSDGMLAAVLHSRSVSWIETIGPSILDDSPVGATSTLLGSRLARNDPRAPAALTTSPTANSIDPVSVVAPVMQVLQSPPSHPIPVTEAAAIPAVKVDPKPAEDEANPEVAPPVVPEPEGSVPDSETGLDPNGPEMPEMPEATAAPGDEPVLPEHPAEEKEESKPVPPGLAGRLSGDLPAGLEVLIYGPDNIIRLYGRAEVGEDGTWSAPQPPAGRYRLVIAAPRDHHVFTSPEFRTIVIVREDAGMDGIDFEVRGEL